jgi:hypothetical protein
MVELLLDAVRNNLQKAKSMSTPFRHWIYDRVFSEAIAHELSDLPLQPPTIQQHKGKRDTYNSSRVFLNSENCHKYPVLRSVVDVFNDSRIISQLGDICGRDLTQGKLRIEHTLDNGDFWLEPHLDIKEKLLTFLVYLSKGGDSSQWGTELYNPDLSLYAKVPYKLNLGFMFMAGKNTWHGVPKQQIIGVRKSLIINYVSNEWQSLHELAPDIW